jgi:hypothetical protein
MIDEIPAMFTIHVCVMVKVSENKFRRLRRTTTLAFVPRVGDFLCDESWGITFDHEGVEVKSVGISLDDGDVFVWIENDLTTWKDMDSVPWKDADDMVDECYQGFSEWPKDMIHPLKQSV